MSDDPIVFTAIVKAESATDAEDYVQSNVPFTQRRLALATKVATQWVVTFNARPNHTPAEVRAQLGYWFQRDAGRPPPFEMGSLLYYTSHR